MFGYLTHEIDLGKFSVLDQSFRDLLKQIQTKTRNLVSNKNAHGLVIGKEH